MPRRRDGYWTERIYTLGLDATAWHSYAAEWSPHRVRLYVDDRLVRVVQQRIDYPLQLMVDLFEFPEDTGRDPSAHPKAGEAQAPALSLRAKQRSIHNNYLTFPLLFLMLSNHFPAAYGHHLNWLVLIAVMVGGAGVRHFMNVRYLGEGHARGKVIISV